MTKAIVAFFPAQCLGLGVGFHASFFILRVMTLTTSGQMPPVLSLAFQQR